MPISAMITMRTCEPPFPQRLGKRKVFFAVDVDELLAVPAPHLDQPDGLPVPVAAVLEEIVPLEEIQGVRELQHRLHRFGIDRLHVEREVQGPPVKPDEVVPTSHHAERWRTTAAL